MILEETDEMSSLSWQRPSGHNCIHAASENDHECVLRNVLAAASTTPSRRSACAAAIRAQSLIDGALPLHQACFVGSFGCVTALLEFDARYRRPTDTPLVTVPMRPSFATPLYLAAAGGHAALVSALIESGALRGVGGSQGSFTPIHTAAQSGSVETLVLLLSACPTLLEHKDPDGRTALAKALSYNNIEAARFLVLAGAAPRYQHGDMLVDMVDEAHARRHRSFANWLRDVDLLRDNSRLPILCFSNDLPRVFLVPLLRAGVDVDVVPVRAFSASASSSEEDDRDHPRVVLDAARPWSIETHHLFPSAARVRAVAAFLAGVLLEKQRQLPHFGTIVLDRILSFAIARGEILNDDRAAFFALYAGRDIPG